MSKQLSNVQKKQQEEGQGLVEYALILVLVSVVVVVVLSQMGPAVGNIFSGVVSALDGGAVAEEEDGGCTKVPTINWWIDVESGGRIPAGSMQYVNSDCSTQAGGGIDFDSVMISQGAGVSAATSACQSHFGKTLRFPNDASSEIWTGSGFWYCTP